jgi:hypothetical protein
MGDDGRLGEGEAREGGGVGEVQGGGKSGAHVPGAGTLSITFNAGDERFYLNGQREMH